MRTKPIDLERGTLLWEPNQRWEALRQRPPVRIHEYAQVDRDEEPPIAVFDGPPLAPSLRAPVEWASVNDCTFPTAYGSPRRVPTTRHPDHSGVT